MKRQLLTALVLLFATVASWAQNAVAVYQNDGTVATFAFTEKPVVTYSGNDLVLTTTKTSSTTDVHASNTNSRSSSSGTTSSRLMMPGT